MNCKRRKFIAAAAAAGVLSSCSLRRGPWRFFTASEMDTVRALADCLIPPDDYPGGADAGVPIFLDRQLSRHYRKFQELYRAGLSALDRVAKQSAGKRFHELAPDGQCEILRALEAGKPPAGWSGGPDCRRFFNTLLAHAHQGYYGDPRHGGNRGGLGYQMVGVPATNIRGRSQHDARIIPVSEVRFSGGQR